MTNEELVESSKKLARWTPRLMLAIATAVMKATGIPLKPRLCSWKTHVQRDHFLFRKDCQVCQEAAARGAPHYRQRLPPRAGVLSLDITGPFKKANDLERGSHARYILAGAITWPTGLSGADQEAEDGPDPPEEAPELAEQLSEVEDPGVPKRGRPRHRRPEDDSEDQDDGDETEAEHQVEEDGHHRAQIEVHRVAIPIETRAQGVVLRAIIDLVLMLRAEGITVTQLHTDRGGEFRSKRLRTWCRERNVLQTWTAGDEPQSNGRAEKAVQDTKRRVRVLLHSAGVGEEYWPIAVRNVNERWRIGRLGKPDRIPPFLADVLVKKRYWKERDLEPTHERVRYLSPSWVHHGHWILRPDGTRALTRAVLAHTTEPIKEEVWIALEGEPNPLEARRRIRGKTTVKALKVEDLWGEEEKMPEEDRERWEKVVQEEMMRIIGGDHEVVPLVLQATQRIEEELDQGRVEEAILQTKIISPTEVRERPESWRQAITAEITSLFETKKALKVLGGDEARELIKSQRLQAIPSKVVFTIKPEAGNPRGKKKCRIVACGNFAQGDPGDCFASGADAAALRIAIAYATHRGWQGLNLDVKTAFLNAPMQRETSDDHQEGLQRVLLKPAGILVQLGYFKSDEYWDVLKALYGFKQAPRLWGDYRDDVLRSLEVDDMILIQMDSEPSMWIVRKRGIEEIQGLILTYVDDILILARQAIVVIWCKKIQDTWECSAPEWITSTSPTRFLGMELRLDSEGAWMAAQANYTMDTLIKNLGSEQSRWEKRSIPMLKGIATDSGDEAEDEETPEVTPEAVRTAQRIVGELTWLVTRCRPDLMYTVSKMAALTTRNPSLVERMAKQTWMYLVNTVNDSIRYDPAGSLDLVVYTDASYGNECHGCVLVMWLGGPVLWRSSRQSIVTTSTAAAELVEIVEGAIMTEAIRVVVEEIIGRATVWQWTDSQAALAIATGETRQPRGEPVTCARRPSS